MEENDELGKGSVMWTPEAVRELRRSLGNLSQSQFAKLVGCHVRAISKWERGERTPTGLYARRLNEIALDEIARDTAYRQDK